MASRRTQIEVWSLGEAATRSKVGRVNSSFEFCLRIDQIVLEESLHSFGILHLVRFDKQLFGSFPGYVVFYFGYFCDV